MLNKCNDKFITQDCWVPPAVGENGPKVQLANPTVEVGGYYVGFCKENQRNEIYTEEQALRLSKEDGWHSINWMRFKKISFVTTDWVACTC